MANEALIERLEKLDVETIEKMSPEVIARLTHNFEEFLVRNMLYIATTNYDQRRLIKVIKEAYKSWKKDTDMFWGTLPQLEVYPEYMEELQTDIECGLVITEKGIFEEDHARLKISLISSNAVPLKALQKGFESVMRTDKEKTAASNQKRLTDNSYIESLEAENARLREELAGKNNETIGEQDSPQPESSSSEIAKLKACIKELQDALNEEKAKNAKLEEEIANRSQINRDEFEKTKHRNEVLETLYEAAENRLKRYESILGTEEQISKEKKFSIAERIIFCSSLLGCGLSEDDISQMQMAKLIARFSGDKWESIRTTISEMNGKRTALVDIAKKADKENDAGARATVWRIEGEKYKGITNAALNVYNYLHAAVKGGTIGAKVHGCQQAMENINQAYYLTERKLIDRTYRQPEGEFELPPDKI